MAKKIKLSNDGGTTYATFPGPDGEVSINGEGIDDTILGQTFSSELIGLINWSVSTSGIFKGFAGYLVEIKKQGTPTVADAESFTLESGKIYAINNAAKEIWDRTDTVVVYDNAVDHTADIEWVDYLFGRVKFNDSYTVTGPVTADVSYMPTASVGCGQSYTLGMTADTKDESCFPNVQANGGHRVYSAGLRTVELELDGIFKAADALEALIVARAELMLEIDVVGDGSSIARGFFRAKETSRSGAVGALEEESTTFTLTVPDEVTGPEAETPFNWRHTSTTLSLAVQYAITSWISELNTYDVQYLPQGTIGQSPLDGIEGNVVVTDISLSGGLSNMNVFEIELQGTGAYTVV